MFASFQNPGSSGCHKWGHLAFLAFVSLSNVDFAAAAPGDLDPTFSGNGLLSLRPGDAEAQAHAITQQTDGKLVLAGWGPGGFMAARVAEDGTPDRAFGVDGFATAAFPGGNSAALAVLQQPDGKLVLAGITDSTNGYQEIALARFNSDGVLDDGFGNGGALTLDLGGSHDRADALIQQADGKLVIAGASISGDRYLMVLVRFNSDGTIDTTFGSSGTTLVDFGGGSGSTGSAIGQQSDGKLVVAGTVYDGGWGAGDVGIARLTANGALDRSFDGDGRLRVDVSEQDQAFDVAIQLDDAIVVGGCSFSAAGIGGAALLRVHGDGSMDNSFGNAGKAVLDYPGCLHSIVAQADGKLVATGTRGSVFEEWEMILARFNANGSLDSSFGIDGVATADFGTGSSTPLSVGDALIRQSDGKYVAAGWNELYFMCAARFDDNGAFPGLLGLTDTGQDVTESAGPVTYTVRRTGGRSGAVSVDYATAAGNAQPGSDFEAASGTLMWNDGDSSSRTIVINLVDDDVAETDKDFMLILSAPTGGAQVAASEATTVIASEDGPGQLGFGIAAGILTIRESDPFCEADDFGGYFSFNVPIQRRAGSEGAVGVSYATSDGTATAPADYKATSGTLQWADGEIGVKTIRVPFAPDRVAESDEELRVELSNPTGGAAIDPSAGTLTVRILNVDNSRCGVSPPPPPPPPPSPPPPPPLRSGGGGGAEGFLTLVLLAMIVVLRSMGPTVSKPQRVRL